MVPTIEGRMVLCMGVFPVYRHPGDGGRMSESDEGRMC